MTMDAKLRIGVDVGGTNMRAALVGKEGVVAKAAVPCPARGTEREVAQALENIVARLMSPRVEAIGVGVPSVVDRAEGVVYNVANIPSWRNVPLKAMLQDRFKVPVSVNNDSNCFALGEARFGSGRGFKDFVGITLGTGLGAGVIVGGRLYSGNNTGAGEVGSFCYKDSDIEHYCSSSFFASKLGTTAVALSRRALAGDQQAMEGWRQFGIHLGRMAKQVMFAYDPEAIIIGGGIARSFCLFEKPMRQTMATFPYPRSVERLRLLPSTLADAALLGAACLPEEELGE